MSLVLQQRLSDAVTFSHMRYNMHLRGLSLLALNPTSKKSILLLLLLAESFRFGGIRLDDWMSAFGLLPYLSAPFLLSKLAVCRESILPSLYQISAYCYLLVGIRLLL